MNFSIKVFVFFTINIFSSNPNFGQASQLEFKRLPIIINPDNLLSGITGLEDTQEDAYNSQTHLGGYYREDWIVFERHNKISWDHLEKKMRWCAERHTRLTMRVSQFSGYPYDKDTLRYPVTNNNAYNIYINNHGLSVGKDGIITKNNKVIKTGFPQYYFWEMVKEGCNPLIIIGHENDNFYVACPDYNSDLFYKAWYVLNKKLSKWLKGYLRKGDGTIYYVNNKPIRRKHLIEVMQAGFVGMFGEGWIKQYGVFPNNMEKLYRYVRIYPNLFYDIPLSYPLAVCYDKERYGMKGLEYIFSVRNKHGLSGLYYDVIGQENFHPYFNNSEYGVLLRSLDFNNRRIGGEGSGYIKSEGLRDLINHACGACFSGVSLQNFAIYGERDTPETRHNMKKFKFLVGAKLHLSDVELKKYKKRYSISFQIQNIGLAKVFSPFWKPYVIFRDEQGNELSRSIIPIDIKGILPNSQDCDFVGRPQIVKPISFDVKIPNNTSFINFAIIDIYGIYENYWLYNDNRLQNGEYVLYKLN